MNAGSMVAIILCVSFIALSKPAFGQGFFFGPGYGAAPPWRVDLSIGVPPSFPYPIGVPQSHLIHPRFSPHGHYPPIGTYRDYRLEYNLRVLQAHQAQLEFAQSLGLISPLGVNPLHQDEVYRRLGSGETMPHHFPALPRSALGYLGEHSLGPDAESDAVADWRAVTPEDLAAISDQLILSARRLDQSLTRRGEEGDVWRQYLSTESIVASDRQPLTDSEWTKVLQNFDGVVANGDLRWVMRSDGFAETRQWASAWVKAKRAIANQVNDDGVPITPSHVPPPAPSPSGNQQPNFEVLPPPTRARL
jgi:hypothetical protein